MDTEGNLMKLRHEIQRILPAGWSQANCMEIQIEAKDWIPFETAKFDLDTPFKAPLMKNMPVNYRLKLKPTLEAAEPTKKLKKRLVRRPLKRKITPKSSEVIEVSDTEQKAKKMKQQKLNQMKKVRNSSIEL